LAAAGGVTWRQEGECVIGGTAAAILKTFKKNHWFNHFISTSATRFRPLQAMTRFPSRVAIMLRTTPPPEGIVHVWNFSALGSKRTRVLGLTPDSLYQTTSFSPTIP